jgi:hypothetical protein
MKASLSTLSVAERIHISFMTCLHRFGAVPAIPTTRIPAMPISRLNHTAFAIAVYASCRGFPATSKTRFRLAANLYRVGLLAHRDILKDFTNMGSLLLLPSWAYHGATESRFREADRECLSIDL